MSKEFMGELFKSPKLITRLEDSQPHWPKLAHRIGLVASECMDAVLAKIKRMEGVVFVDFNALAISTASANANATTNAIVVRWKDDLDFDATKGICTAIALSKVDVIVLMEPDQHVNAVMKELAYAVQIDPVEQGHVGTELKCKYMRLYEGPIFLDLSVTPEPLPGIRVKFKEILEFMSEYRKSRTDEMDLPEYADVHMLVYNSLEGSDSYPHKTPEQCAARIKLGEMTGKLCTSAVPEDDDEAYCKCMLISAFSRAITYDVSKAGNCVSAISAEKM